VPDVSAAGDVPIVKHAVASPATLAAAQNRRKTNANFTCELCGSSFTREFNLKSASFFASSSAYADKRSMRRPHELPLRRAAARLPVLRAGVQPCP
jgi:hypothetical protein